MRRNLFSFDQPQPGFPLVPPSIGGPIGGKCKIWAKCWSEWQDLPMRLPTIDFAYELLSVQFNEAKVSVT